MIDWNPIAEKFGEADAILIGASNGLSITEGLHLFADNAAFEKLFGDFKRKYGLGCILQGMMAGWPNEEEKWAFWARLIHHYCGRNNSRSDFVQWTASASSLAGFRMHFNPPNPQ